MKKCHRSIVVLTKPVAANAESHKSTLGNLRPSMLPMGAMPLLYVLTATLICTTHVLAQKVKAAPDSGHPTATMMVSGSKFGDLEAIDVYIDTVDTLLLVSSATGSFSGSVTIPVSASPGTHYVTAIGRKSGDAAQVAITVTTPWAQIGFGSAHQDLHRLMIVFE